MHGQGISNYYDDKGQPRNSYEGLLEYNKKHGVGKMINHTVGLELIGNWFNDTFSDQEAA